MKDLNLTLPDGRTLAFVEYGDASGLPVLFFHGFPGSRLQAGDFSNEACRKHCRLIGVDRPGMGGSAPNKSHTLLSWADDIKYLLNELNIDKVSIVAHSGGAPFSLSCAHLLPDRIRNITLVSPLAPTTSQKAKEGMMMGYRVINTLVRTIPGFSYLLMMLQKNLILRPNVFKKIIKKMPHQDQVIFENERFQTQALDALCEAFQQGVNGAAYEFQLIVKKWPFKLDEINTPISIWHGKKDMQVPRSFINILSSGLPHSTIHSLPEEAHLSTLYNHIVEILETIKSD